MAPVRPQAAGGGRSTPAGFWPDSRAPVASVSSRPIHPLFVAPTASTYLRGALARRALARRREILWEGTALRERRMSAACLLFLLAARPMYLVAGASLAPIAARSEVLDKSLPRAFRGVPGRGDHLIGFWRPG